MRGYGVALLRKATGVECRTGRETGERVGCPRGTAGSPGAKRLSGRSAGTLSAMAPLLGSHVLHRDVSGIPILSGQLGAGLRAEICLSFPDSRNGFEMWLRVDQMRCPFAFLCTV